MAVVIDFAAKRREKLELKKIKLSTFGLTEKDVDIVEMFPYIDPKYKVKIMTTEGNEKEFVRCSKKRELFEELIRTSKAFDSRRVAWIVLDTNTDYVYIKELDQMYKAEKGVFEQKIKASMYEYGIDYLLILEKISEDTYRWVAV